MDIIYTDKHRLHATDKIAILGELYITDELPARGEALHEAVLQAGFGPVLPPLDFGLGPILAVHSPDYIDYLRHAYEQNAAYYQNSGMKNIPPLVPDTFAPRSARRKPDGFLGQMGYYAFGTGSPVLAGTWEAAYWSAQCALTAAHRVQQAVPAGKPACAYAICRPPGHHSGKELYGGFCYLNNAAIAAKFLGKQVAILDIDYHHGNGTQEIFYSDPRVLFCSLHAHPDEDYPYYWGEESETGEGEGTGFNRNWTLPQGVQDAQYLAALNQALGVIRAYRPNYLVISAGFDTLQGDPVGGFALTLDGLAEIGRRIAGLNLPCVIVQEGGYLLGTLGEAAVAFLRGWIA